MSLLFRVVFASHCRSTHHKLAMESLRFLQGADASRWRRLFLKNHAAFLEGSKAPDKDFKDFRNHVLHVADNCWGGAARSARKWYTITVESLRKHDWDYGVYAAGVLSHYFSDPLMPFHTAQSQAESNIHRATEWSICKSYDELSEISEKIGYPSLELSDADDWLEQFVVQGAELSHSYYDALIEHYDFDRGVSDPPSGLDDVSREFLARLLGHASVGFARILERAVAEADVRPPDSNLTVAGFLASLQIPIHWVTRKISDAQDRATIEAMYDELKRTGEVSRTLGEDERTIKRMYRKEVGTAASPASVPRRTSKVESKRERPSGNATVPRVPASQPTERPKSLRFYLETSSEIEDAPSIGRKTARRLGKIGILSVSDLLARQPDEIAQQLDVHYIDAQTVGDWQDQARLCCQIPSLRGHDAQILVACEFREPARIAGQTASELLATIEPFVESSAGQRILRSGKAPDMAEVTDWIAAANQARLLSAA